MYSIEVQNDLSTWFSLYSLIWDVADISSQWHILNVLLNLVQEQEAQRLRDAHEKEMTRLGYELEQARTAGQHLVHDTILLSMHSWCVLMMCKFSRCMRNQQQQAIAVLSMWHIITSEAVLQPISWHARRGRRTNPQMVCSCMLMISACWLY